MIIALNRLNHPSSRSNLKLCRHLWSKIDVILQNEGRSATRASLNGPRYRPNGQHQVHPISTSACTLHAYMPKYPSILRSKLASCLVLRIAPYKLYFKSEDVF